MADSLKILPTKKFTGTTGHVEVCEIHFEPNLISYEKLLDIFFHVHDPCSLNRQGNDVGTQYRSIIITLTEEQNVKARSVKEQLDKSGEFSRPLVTEIKSFETFYEAEGYHQDYYNTHPGQGYCAYVIQPKLEKFRQRYKSNLE